jgi:RNA recognition motif-containing protein
MKKSNLKVSAPFLLHYMVNNRAWMIEMKISLYHLLMTHGEVVEVTIRPTANLRGQAFVTFREQEMADRALKELAGFNLFGNKMVNTNLSMY